jgi:hypothetical protein
MGRTIFLLLLIFSIPQHVFPGNDTSKLLEKLDYELSQKEIYLKQKEDRIVRHKQVLELSEEAKNNQIAFEQCLKVLSEYESFMYDSAFKYVLKLNEIALELENPDIFAFSKTKLGFTLLSSGLFKESLDTLLSINTAYLTDSVKEYFYSVTARTYYDLADYNNDRFFTGKYEKIGTQYLDSALAIIPNSSQKYWSTMGLRRMKAGDIQGSADAFNFLISQFDISDHTFAIATSSLGYLYSILDRDEEAVDMLIKAAIADIRSSTMETVALRNLAVHLHRQGDIKRSYRYIKIALDDATTYNARHRKVEVGAVLPIIEGERLATVERQRKQLLNYSFIMSMLSVLVISFFSIIFVQLNKLNKVKQKLQETNNNLLEINRSLSEANTIKQEYIGYFFSTFSEYIDKIEQFRKKLHRKITTRQFTDLDSIVNNTDLKRERQNLFDNFDRIFLKIFPDFIDQFNSMLNENDHIYPEKDELLNTDLRIFALIRLGITDNEKIASFLNYSVNTIYTYKTKIKNKAVVSRDDFEKKLMEIRSI